MGIQLQREGVSLLQLRIMNKWFTDQYQVIVPEILRLVDEVQPWRHRIIDLGGIWIHRDDNGVCYSMRIFVEGKFIHLVTNRRDDGEVVIFNIIPCDECACCLNIA